MLYYALFQKFLLSLALGALIGVEREKAQQKYQFKDIAGIRTFMLITFFGTLGAYIGDNYQFWIIGIFFGGFILLVLAGYVIRSINCKNVGMTTEISALIAFVIGLICYFAPKEIPIIITIVIAVILSIRSFLHNFVYKLKKKELYDTIKFAIIAFVILPLLPNQAYGPFKILNPYEIWLMVVFISGISFVGYVLIKWFGSKRGLAFTGLLGGLVSSTATISSIALRAKSSKKVLHSFIIVAILANSIMFLRTLLEIIILNKALLVNVSIPLLAMAAVGFFSAFILWKSSDKSDPKVEYKSPFSIKPAITFGVFFALILLVSKAGEIYFGTSGIYVASILSGIADMDAITISVAKLAGESVTYSVAAKAITFAACVSTLVKLGIAIIFGSRKFGKRLAPVFIITVAVGLTLLFLM